jgi:uroporphyrinogen-III synthase
MTTPSFGGLRVLALESRREREMAALITTHGGEARVAPSMRELPLESNTAATAFADALVRGEFDVVVLLTGVGTRVLLDVVERTQESRDGFVAALGRVRVAVRGPKPLAVLRELGLTPWVTAPEPNTWRELLAAIDAAGADASLSGQRVAVQEYGTSNPELVAGLEARGARVTAVPVYQWALPEDLGPLEDACRALATEQVDVALFTTATQVVHLLQVAERMGAADSVRAALGRVVVGSIGPTTSDELRAHGIDVDMEPSHPKMGLLVREAAQRAAALRTAKQAARS